MGGRQGLKWSKSKVPFHREKGCCVGSALTAGLYKNKNSTIQPWKRSFSPTFSRLTLLSPNIQRRRFGTAGGFQKGQIIIVEIPDSAADQFFCSLWNWDLNRISGQFSLYFCFNAERKENLSFFVCLICRLILLMI